jgi:hypothetical protein
MQWSFEYGTVRVCDLRIQPSATPKQVRSAKIEINGEPLATSGRFWKSFFLRFGVSDKIFRYFDHAEVFARVSERSKDDRLRYCIERGESGGRLLAVTNPARPVIDYHHVSELIQRYDGEETGYDCGVVVSTHTPRSGGRGFDIGGDRFEHRFVMETPVDGFSNPKLFLSFLRLICANGAVGYSRAFRSDINNGKDLRHCIERALDSFDNGDGYAALRQRFESAQVSWASLYECGQLYKALATQINQRNIARGELMRDFHQMTGKLNEFYGLANLDALSAKRQRVLPAKCRIYDLINFASEVATHHATAAGSRSMQAYIGGLIADEYDMEGTAEAVGDFADLFIDGGAGPRPSVN